MKNWVDKGTEFAWEFENFCNAKGKRIYSTMSGTNAAFAEGTIGSKKFSHRFMENYA